MRACGDGSHAFRPLAKLLDLTRLNATDLAVVTACALLPIAIVEVQKLGSRVRRS